jgi:hypothetical protein
MRRQNILFACLALSATLPLFRQHLANGIWNIGQLVRSEHTHLARHEAVRLAQAEAKKRGIDLGCCGPPTVHFDRSTGRGLWTVTYTDKPSRLEKAYGFFWVWIEDESGMALLGRPD